MGLSHISPALPSKWEGKTQIRNVKFGGTQVEPFKGAENHRMPELVEISEVILLQAHAHLASEDTKTQFG